MNREQERILGKVKKLFALSKSPNINEASAALKKANELLKEYNIKYKHSDFHEEVMGKKTWLLWQKTIVIIVTNYYESKPILFQSGIIVIGEQLNVKLSIYAIKYLFRVCASLIRKFRKTTKYCTKNKVKSYINGLLYGLHDLLPAKENKKLDYYFQEKYQGQTESKKVITKKGQDLKSLNQGYIDGKKIVISKGVEKEHKIKRGLLT